MNIITYSITATFEVAVNADDSMPPDADGMAVQLRSAIGAAVKAWQDKLRSLIVGDVSVAVAAPIVPAPPAPTPAPEPAPAPEPPAPAPTEEPAPAPTEPRAPDQIV